MLTFLGVKAFLARVPRGVWIALGIALLTGLGLFLHSRAVSKFGQEQFDKGVKHEQNRIAKKVKRILIESEKVSSNARRITETNLNRITSSARVVLMQGPGKAACSPAVSIPASPPRRSDPAGSASVVDLPPREREPLFGLPASGAVALAAQHDSCWVKAKAWEDWYRQQSEIWKKSN